MSEFLKTRQEISDWLKQYEIEHYKLEEDKKYGFTVRARYNVGLFNKGLSFIPVKFSHIGGMLNIADNNISSLEFCPETVSTIFMAENNQLTSLIGGPRNVGDLYNVSNNKLVNLKGAPQYLLGGFNCHNNALTSLEGGPKVVMGNFEADGNHLTSLEHGPERIGGLASFSYNELEQIDYLPKLNRQILLENNLNLGKIGQNDSGWRAYEEIYEIYLINLEKRKLAKGIPASNIEESASLSQSVRKI